MVEVPLSDHESRGLKRWMLAVAVVQLVMGTGLAAAVASRTARVEAQAETRGIAQDVVRQEWLTRLEAETRRVAAEAAGAAADKAVREAVIPIAVSTASHNAMDDQRQHETERRIEALERARLRR
jgi:hypothetical protein